MKTKPHITQSIGFYLLAFILIGALIISVMPQSDRIAELEKQIESMGCK